MRRLVPKDAFFWPESCNEPAEGTGDVRPY